MKAAPIKTALLKCTITRSVVCNCRTCKYGFINPHRQLPVCRIGMQIDCISDNYDHWTPNDAVYQNVEVLDFYEVEENESHD